MDHELIQIELLYCQYGWPIDKIATTIGQPITYVSMAIDKSGWVQGSAMPKKDDALVRADDAPSGQAFAIQQLKDKEVDKQAMLAPLVAITEIRLLGKLSTAISSVDSEDPDAHVKLANLVKSFKQLTQDSVTSKVIDDVNGKPGVAVQVITQIM